MIHVIILSLHLFFIQQTTTGTATLTIKVKGINISRGGELSVGIFQEANFPKPGKQLIGTAVPVTASEMEVVFKEVPTGIFAVVAFQDIDANKDLKKNFIGFPKEPIGFSNDARIRMGPPSFSDAAIAIEPGKNRTIQIILR